VEVEMRRTAFVVLAVLLIVGCPKKNHAPDTPSVPTGPSTVAKDSTASFSSSAIDPDDDSVAIRFDWGNGDTSAWGGRLRSGSIGKASCAYPRPGSFQVRAQARDVNEAPSVWSDPLSVTIRNPHPSTPFGPHEGGLRETLGFFSTVSDSGGDSVSIRFSWGDGDTSAWSARVRTGDTVRMNHAWRDVGSFPVMAQAEDEEGLTSSWSSPRTVTITRLKWCYQTGDSIRSSPAVAADGTVYVGSDDSYLYALNPDGSLRWRFQTDGSIGSSPAVAADGTVYIGSNDGCLYAINPDGSLKWRYPTGDSIWSSSAVAADGTVYVGSHDRYLYALYTDGSLRWRYLTGNSIWSSPAVAADGTVYVGSGGLYAINPDGSLRWRFQTGSHFRSSPAVAADGTVYVGSWSLVTYLYALYPDGTLRWRYPCGYGIFSSPAVAADGTVYVGARADDLCAINPAGELEWRYQTGSLYSSPAVAVDGTVYVGSYGGYLYAINLDGSLKWRYQTGYIVESSTAIAADGTVYVASHDGYLYAIIGDSPLADSPWPKFHHDNKNTGRVGGGQR
jgi:outer membrane protein assembly factor BamB